MWKYEVGQTIKHKISGQEVIVVKQWLAPIMKDENDKTLPRVRKYILSGDINITIEVTKEVVEVAYE
jgi:hypothetical protein|tara:strand:- start:14290 stop:14490 length:201 start_codon:yes stop_codon:yes gene_type:complete